MAYEQAAGVAKSVLSNVKPDQLDEVVPEADVVFISAPDTAKSHKMMGMREFDLASRNRFFLCVEAADPRFERAATRRFLESLAPLRIAEVASDP